MKLLIIEGLDRCGKDTLIQRLQEESQRTETVHWGFPQGSTNEEKTAYQKSSFLQNMVNYHMLNTEATCDILIWNRAHIGEYVYGPLYRESDPNWVFELENQYLAEEKEVYLVLLYADPSFLVKEDDGKSFSTDLNKKAQEVRLFFEAFGKSRIPQKLLIKVNDGPNYIDQEQIFQSVKNFVSL